MAFYSVLADFFFFSFFSFLSGGETEAREVERLSQMPRQQAQEPGLPVSH